MLSSGDNLTSRELYENNQTFEQTAKFIACMNNIGNFNKTDEATIERFTIIPFTGKYITGAPTSQDEQIKTNTYERDLEFSDKVKNYVNALLWVLIKDYNTKGIYKKSEDDIKLSDEYFKDYNIYNKFISDNLIVEDNRKESKLSLSIKDVFPIFNKWYSEGRYKGS
jgi:phage/plasmid-associated DNA primase